MNSLLTAKDTAASFAHSISFSLLFLGLALGLLSATVSESMGHRFFGHPSTLQLKLYNRFPNFFAAFLRCYYHHFVVHHEMTYQVDVLTQFRSLEEKSRIDRWLREQFPMSFVELIWRENYNLTLKGIDGVLPFATPFLTGPVVIGSFFGWTAFAGSLLTAFLPVFFSKYFHPFIHEPIDVEKLPLLFRLLAKSRYMKWVLKNHYLHHLHVESNFNLLLGGDYLLGHHRDASVEEDQKFAEIWERFMAV